MPTPIAFAANLNEATPPAIPYIIPPGTGVAAKTLPADLLADSAASVNSSICSNASSFGSTQTATDVAAQTYLKIGGFRHLRDGPIDCYNEPMASTFFNNLYNYEGVDQMVSNFGYLTIGQLVALNDNIYPGIKYVGSLNEDDADLPERGTLYANTVPGQQTVSLGYGMAQRVLIPGQTYKMSDQSGETFVLTASQSDPSSAALTLPLQFAHVSGTPVIRVGDFVSDVSAWYRTEAPFILRIAPQQTILGPSLSHPINAYIFNTDGVHVGGLFDVAENHGYPNGNRNPEGALGDGYTSDIGLNFTPCSYNGTSFSFMFSTVCSVRQLEGYGYENTPNFITEYAYEVCPVGARATTASPSCIPDDVAVDYLVASEIFSTTHGISRLMWFQIRDGVSGISSGFCTYGLIRDSECNATFPRVPQPKPEMLALMALIGYFDDDTCMTPDCTFNPISLDGTWSASGLPLNTANFEWSNGKVAVAFWKGAPSYSDITAGSCLAKTSCYLTVNSTREKFSSPFLDKKAVYVTGVDDIRTDPTPAPYATTAPDGTHTVITKCPSGPTVTPEFGCILPMKSLTVSGTGANSSVWVTAKREMQWIVFQAARPSNLTRHHKHSGNRRFSRAA